MSAQWKYQIRIYLDGHLAEAARFDPGSQKLKWLSSVLAKHRAKLRCQFDLFAEYVAEAERVGTEDYHLYEWTKATIEDPIKRAKYIESFSLYVDDQEVYAKEIADALEADLTPLVENGQIKKLSKHDSNPANNPQPPARRRADRAHSWPPSSRRAAPPIYPDLIVFSSRRTVHLHELASVP